MGDEEHCRVSCHHGQRVQRPEEGAQPLKRDEERSKAPDFVPASPVGVVMAPCTMRFGRTGVAELGRAVDSFEREIMSTSSNFLQAAGVVALVCSPAHYV